ncbi:MAG: right-handed parallel beta-helix repeat-containing protein, partial [Planctomycetota bacterium]
NNSSNLFGGGICCSTNTALIKGNTISGNTALVHHGGGIYVSSDASTIVDNVIDDNHAGYYGGGIYWGYDMSISQRGLISGNRITWNRSDHSGGGIYAWYTTAPVSGNFIFGNSTVNFGGGLACELDGKTVVNNIIMMNSAAFGGGVSSTGSDTTLTNNTICYNDGGGLYLSDNALATVSNTIFWGNSTPTGYEIVVGKLGGAPATLTISHSDVEGGRPAVAVQSGSILNWNSGMIKVDPLFVDFDGPDNNIFTWEDNDLHLSAVSPCIDAGDNNALSLPIKDFEGDPRIVHGSYKMQIPLKSTITVGTVDIGADEYSLFKTYSTKPLM